jgi:hypothetical protein
MWSAPGTHSRQGYVILVSLVHEGAGAYTCRDAVPVRCWNSHAQNSLHSHRMTAIPPVMEETTGAMPLTVIIVRGMNIILAPERRLKASELDPFGFFRVTLGFRDFTDHT